MPTERKDLGWAVRNNGLMILSPDPKTMMKDQDFPISIEVSRELLNLEGCMDPKAPNYKSYFVKSDPKMCR